MTKLFTLVAVLLVAAHAATALRTITTTTTTIVSDENDRSSTGTRMSPQCQQEFERRDLSPCMRLVQQRFQQEQQEEEEQQPPRRMRPVVGHEEMERCCSELQSIQRKECVCESLEEETRELMKSEQQREDVKRAMLDTAQELPRMCGVGVPTCRFSSITTSY